MLVFLNFEGGYATLRQTDQGVANALHESHSNLLKPTSPIISSHYTKSSP